MIPVPARAFRNLRKAIRFKEPGAREKDAPDHVRDRSPAMLASPAVGEARRVQSPIVRIERCALVKVREVVAREDHRSSVRMRAAWCVRTPTPKMRAQGSSQDEDGGENVGVVSCRRREVVRNPFAFLQPQSAASPTSPTKRTVSWFLRTRSATSGPNNEPTHATKVTAFALGNHVDPGHDRRDERPCPCAKAAPRLPHARNSCASPFCHSRVSELRRKLDGSHSPRCTFLA